MGLRDRIKSLLGVRAKEGRGGGVGVMGYDAGRQRRQDSEWNPPAMGINALADSYLASTVNRVRWLVDNNPTLGGARDTIRNNLIGKGMWPVPDTGMKSLDQKISDWWWKFAEGADAERKSTVNEILADAFNDVFAAGEVLAYYPIAPAFRGYPLAPSIELVDSCRLDLGLEGKVGANRVRQSVETDPLGRVVAYHVMGETPNDGGLGWSVSTLGGPGMIRLRAEDATLVMRRRRLKQLRGVPWPVSVVTTVRMEDAFTEAFLLLAQVAASVGVWIEGMPGGMPVQAGTTPPIKTADGRNMQRLMPGQIGILPTGAKAAMLGANTPPPTFESTDKLLLRRMAAGLGMSYSVLSRDYSAATFSSQRAEKLEDRQGYRPGQEMLWTQTLRPFYLRQIEWGTAFNGYNLTSGERAYALANPDKLIRHRVRFSGWDWVNPQQEASADEIALRVGSKSLEEVCAARGEDWEEVTVQRAKERRRMRELEKEYGLKEGALSAGDAAAAPAPDPVNDQGEPADQPVKPEEKAP